MFFSRKLITIFIIQLTEVLGFSLILPFLPYYAQDLGASAFQVGILFSTFSFFQLFSAPIMGQLSDRYGRRPLLILSQISTMVSFFLLGFADTLFLIYVSRIIDGLLGSNFTIAQSYLSDISSRENRSKYFSIPGIAFGLGFMVGPGLGGYLSQFGYAVPSFLAGGIALLSIFMTYFFLPETVTKRTDEDLHLTLIDVAVFKQYLRSPIISPKLLRYFLYLLTHSLWVSSFALYADIKLSFAVSEVGILLTFVGILSVILRGLLPKFIDWFGERRLLLAGTFSLVVSMILGAFIANRNWFYVVMALFAFGTGVSRPLHQGSLSRAVSDKEQGALMGLIGSLGSISQIVGPLIGGFLIQTFSPDWMSVAASIFMSGVLYLLIQNGEREKSRD